MTNNWNDIKAKFLKSGNPIIIYIGISVLFFLIANLFSINGLATQYLAFPSNPEFWLNRFYTIITYQFLHRDFFKLLFNMLWLFWMGQLLLDFIKPRQFHFIYLGGAIVGAIFYALIFNLIPSLKNAEGTYLIGSSAAVMAILAATATLIPDYSIQLMFFGQVRIKFVVLAYILIDVLSIISIDPGSSIAHLGGAIFGLGYIKLLQSGTDITKLFQRKPKLKVVRNQEPKKSSNTVNQREVDAVLDKISKSGYEKLTKEEKDVLFRASKN